MLASDRYGDGPHAVAVLHGFLGSRRNVATLARRLAERDRARSVVALDLTGHGESPSLPPGADLATVATDVRETLAKLGLTGPVHLVGHSLGGRVALRAADIAPSTIEGLTLLDITPSAITTERDMPAVLRALMTAPADAPGREAFRAHFRDHGLDAPLTEWLLTNVARDGDGYRWRIDRERLRTFHARTSREDLWPVIERPRRFGVHVVRGARSGYVDEADVARFTAAGCRVDTVDDAGHWLHAERPAAVLDLVNTAVP